MDLLRAIGLPSAAWPPDGVGIGLGTQLEAGSGMHSGGGYMTLVRVFKLAQQSMSWLGKHALHVNIKQTFAVWYLHSVQAPHALASNSLDCCLQSWSVS